VYIKVNKKENLEIFLAKILLSDPMRHAQRAKRHALKCLSPCGSLNSTGGPDSFLFFAPAFFLPYGKQSCPAAWPNGRPGGIKKNGRAQKKATFAA
jgi:hypothetical protein